MLNLPLDFLNRMQNLLGEEYPAFLNSLQQDIEKAIFVNSNKIDVEKFKSIVDFSLQQIAYEPCGFYVDNQKKGRHALHHVGSFYMQEPSAMFTINSHKFNGNEKVLDMCASPGGKTIQIANRIPNGVLVSNEFVKARSGVLYSNVERMGLKNVIITNEAPENLAEAYANTFDVCVVDAPCSGEGMFRRGNEVTEQWNKNLPDMCANRQLEILGSADRVLKQNGVLIYSTCTFESAENEEIVAWLLREYPDFSPASPVPVGGITLGKEPGTLRLWPHLLQGEGHFVAVLHKGSNAYPTFG